MKPALAGRGTLDVMADEGRPLDWLREAPVFEDPSKTGRARLLLNVVRVLLAAVVLSVILAVLDPNNNIIITVTFYGPCIVLVLASAALLQRRKLEAAGWLISLFLFGLATLVVALFGGLSGANAVTYVTAVMVAGTCLSRAAALIFVALSAVTSGIIVYFETAQLLPPALAPVTPFNAWIAVTITCLIAALLHNVAVKSSESALSESAEALQRLRKAQEETETRALHGKALADLSSSALVATDSRSFCKSASGVVSSLITSDQVVCFEIDDSGKLRVLATYGQGFPVRESLSAQDTPFNDGTRHTLTLKDDEVRSSIAKFRGLAQKSGFLVPIMGTHTTYGFFGVLSNDEREHSKHEEQFLVIVASIIASLIERERVVERAERAQKMEIVGRLAGGVAHDFNNLLTVMSGVSELLAGSVEKDSEDALLLEDLDDAITRATLLGRQLLAFSRRQVLAPSNLNLAELVADFLPMAERLVGDDVVLEAHLPKGSALARADQSSIEQILLNLVVNAREAMPDGGSISVAVEPEPLGGYALVVRDTGTGMDASTQRRLFEPFFTTKAQGTGLGLATVADIVARLGGKISVESKLGKGSAFRVALPPPTSDHSTSKSSEYPLRPEQPRARILLAEDHDLVRNNIVRMLTSAGFEVSAVADGNAALDELSRGEHFDLIITDVTMPGMGGRQLANALQKREHDAPLLFISGYFDAAAKGELPQSAAFLAKPFTREALLAAIGAALEPRSPTG